MLKKYPGETGLDSLFRSRGCTKETAFLLITDLSHQSIRDSLMLRAERGIDPKYCCFKVDA